MLTDATIKKLRTLAARLARAGRKGLKTSELSDAFYDDCKLAAKFIDNTIDRDATGIPTTKSEAAKINREALLLIGAQAPAWSANEDDQLVRIFNQVTELARTAVGAVGITAKNRADWCGKTLDKISDNAGSSVLKTFKTRLARARATTAACDSCGTVCVVGNMYTRGNQRVCSMTCKSKPPVSRVVCANPECAKSLEACRGTVFDGWPYCSTSCRLVVERAARAPENKPATPVCDNCGKKYDPNDGYFMGGKAVCSKDCCSLFKAGQGKATPEAKPTDHWPAARREAFANIRYKAGRIAAFSIAVDRVEKIATDLFLKRHHDAAALMLTERDNLKAVMTDTLTQYDKDLTAYQKEFEA